MNDRPAKRRRVSIGARVARRLPLLGVGLLSMVAGSWLGLVRLGWALPLPWPDQLVVHGPLMVCGFLGTLIGLERAVALGARWGYAGPLLIASGALVLDLGRLGPYGPLLITLGSLIVLAVYLVVCWRQPALFAITMMIGAACWCTGNAQWLAGAAVYRVVSWWVAFLVLTIAGERLELNRVLRPSPAVRLWFAAAIAVIAAGAVVTTSQPAAGVRMLGVGVLALTAWLLRHDVARRTIRQQGLTRFMAAALLAGYGWLGVGGTIAVIAAPTTSGVVYDAMLHAITLGFVMSMVFAHAPVIFPAVLGVPLPYRPVFYVHLGVLHASVALRLVGDLVEDLARWRAWGGVFNAIALLLFLLNTARSIASGPSPGSGGEPRGLTRTPVRPS